MQNRAESSESLNKYWLKICFDGLYFFADFLLFIAFNIKKIKGQYRNSLSLAKLAAAILG